jgi:tyrosinase
MSLQFVIPDQPFRRYWNWSLDAEPQNLTSTRAFESEIFRPDTGFGGNGQRVVATPEQNRLNITGSTGGGCVKDGPFAPPNFSVNLPKPHCLTRDFVPWIINKMADPKLIEEALAQPDYTSFAKTIEKERNFDPSNVHASGHFGVGGILGTMGNAAESPGGK